MLIVWCLEILVNIFVLPKTNNFGFIFFLKKHFFVFCQIQIKLAMHFALNDKITHTHTHTHTHTDTHMHFYTCFFVGHNVRD